MPRSERRRSHARRPALHRGSGCHTAKLRGDAGRNGSGKWTNAGATTARASASIVENTEIEVRTGAFTFRSDEPENRGGKGGAAAAVLRGRRRHLTCGSSSTAARSWASSDLVLRRGKLRIQLRIDSPMTQELVRMLSQHAERACHAACSLAVAVLLHSETLHNGQLL